MLLDGTELRERLLSELEWAGQENLPTLANTAVGPSFDIGLVTLMQQAMFDFVRRGVVRFARERDRDGRLVEMSEAESLAIVADLKTHLQYSDGLGRWTGGKEPWPDVVTTPTGAREARLVLERRGYQWWKSK